MVYGVWGESPVATLRRQMAEADREVARIMSMSDDELVAELVAEGLDPSAKAEPRQD